MTDARLPILLALGLLGAGGARAGSLDAPAAPDAAGSALYSLGDLYNRLNSGTAGSLPTTGFSEPAAGPTAGTLYTLTEIMGKMPALDTTNGAAAANVLQGKTFWGLLSGGGWGPQTGSATIGANVTGANGSLVFDIPDGFYSGKTCTASDTALVAGNIKNGASIFNVTGSYTCTAPSGDAVAADVLSGKTFSNTGATGLTGSMPDKEGDNASTGQSYTSGNPIKLTAPTGFYDGDDTVTATEAQIVALESTDLVTGNVKSGATIFGVAGDSNVVDTSSGDAVAGDLLSGKKAWVDGSEVTGSIATRTLSADSATVSAGYYAATTLTAVDSDLATGNIKSGQTIFGVAGTYPLAAVPKTGQTTSYAPGDDGDLKKGVAWPNPRFTDNGNGTVTDNLTGLIWLKKANCADATRPWATALTDVASLNSAGAMNSRDCGDTSNSADWRLPNIKELQSLVDFAYVDPALPNTAGTGQWIEGSPFSGVQTYRYWSSSTYASNAGFAWFLDLSSGYVGYGSKASDYYVWPVRGGQ
jgi:hypothetical protein